MSYRLVALLLSVWSCGHVAGQSAPQQPLQSVEAGAVIGLQEVGGQVRGMTQAELCWQFSRWDIGAFAGILVEDRSLPDRINVRQSGFLLRYRQPVLPFLTVFAGGRIGWGRARLFTAGLSTYQQVDGLRTEALEAGLQVHLTPRFSLQSGSAFQWLSLPRNGPEWTAGDRQGLSTSLGIRWRFLRTPPDKSQPAG